VVGNRSGPRLGLAPGRSARDLTRFDVAGEFVEGGAGAGVVVLGSDAGRDAVESDGDVGGAVAVVEGDGHAHLAGEGGVGGVEGDGLDDAGRGCELQEAGGEAVFPVGGFAAVRPVGGGVEEGHAITAAGAEVEGVDRGGHVARRLPGGEGGGV